MGGYLRCTAVDGLERQGRWKIVFGRAHVPYHCPVSHSAILAFENHTNTDKHYHPSAQSSMPEIARTTQHR